ncbi:MAG: DNA polymerase III subunit alpha [Eubacteriaceae bacterium]|nr:DNA polymerase III subunit alpha [Eubacteriaceae bacterium]
MAAKFTHLHVHSEFSLLDGFGQIDRIVAETKKLGMDSIAITDHGVLFAAVSFYKECLKQGIKPIIGSEVYVAPRSLTQKEGELDKNLYHLILLAENNTGYKNLSKIVSESFIHGFYYKPRVDYELLRAHSEGIICLSACIAGEIPQLLLQNEKEKAEEKCHLYRDIFGPDNFFLEIQDHRLPEEVLVNKELIHLARKLDIPLVATNDAHYIHRDDAEAHDILLCIQTGTTVEEEKRMRFPNDEFYIKSPEEMAALFIDVPEAITNSRVIARRCEVSFDLETSHLPEFELPPGVSDSQTYLKALCEEGLSRRYGKHPGEEVLSRMEEELSTIHNMGFDNYFLIVWDFIKYAKDRGIMVGPGRGSAAGSLVSYLLDITTLDPLKYQLLFERFLNPERITLPDIDVDFCYERRQEVIDYVTEKYGDDHVAQIITFGTLAARAAVRDVGRVMNMPYNEVDRVAKEIPMHAGVVMTVEKAKKENPTLLRMEEEDRQIAKLLKNAESLQGLSRHASTHAAGVVISDKPLTEYVPLYRNGDIITTQYPMGLLEDLGLIKMDFLGLRTLTVIRDAVENIRYNQQEIIDIDALSYEDYEVYDMLSKGDTLGVFQLESSGMIAFMKELTPQNFEDIVAGISLYRPGPMDQIPRYLANKNNPEAIQYDHPLLEPILDVTYGCMVYQEQVMQIFRNLAGFSLGRSDLVRRAMSKKKEDVMLNEGNAFIYGEVDEQGKVITPGAIRRGVPKEVAEKILSEMMDFAKYAFNKSHAAAYAVIAFQTAWLKCHYPVEFMAALMSSVMDDEKKVSKYIDDCRKMRIPVQRPNINKSYFKFTVDGHRILFGLGAIKGLGKNAIDAIITARKEEGPFKSFGDFCRRVDLKALNKKNVEGLIKSGAFDFTTVPRGDMLLGYDTIMDRVVQEKKDKLAGQISLLDLNPQIKKEMEEDNFPTTLPLSKDKILVMEKDVLGIYISGHPLDRYKSLLVRRTNLTSNLLDSLEDLTATGIRDGDRVSVGGIIYHIKKQLTRTGNLMAFLTLEDLYGKMEVVVFPNTYSQYRGFIKEGDVVLLRGKINYNEEMNISIIAENMQPLVTEQQEATQKKLWIQLENKNKDGPFHAVTTILSHYPGNTPVIIYLSEEKQKLAAPKKLWVNLDSKVREALSDAIGDKNVEVQ